MAYSYFFSGGISRPWGSNNVRLIDNLLLIPQGYPTIVETKLWRNPEARRNVVGQLIDYAKDISRWIFAELEGKVQAYNIRRRQFKLGILDSIREMEDIDEEDCRQNQKGIREVMIQDVLLSSNGGYFD